MATHTLLLGQKTFTRHTSRVYTHAVVGSYNRENELRLASQDSQHDWTNAEYISELMQGTHKHCAYPDMEHRIELLKAQGFTASVEDNVALIIRDRVANFNREVEQGVYDEAVIQWCQSEIAATVQALRVSDSKMFCGVRVVPIQNKALDNRV